MNAPLHAFSPAAPALPLAVSDGQLLHLPPGWIEVQPGFNPRTFFEGDEFAALAESVKRIGVHQALWVRPQAAFDPAAPRFWLIAGERRLRAATAAGLAAVPAMVRLADERQALILADLENNPQFRVNLSPAEEARFARRFLAECEGDRAEAATLLGWSAAKLEARLLLLHAAPAVLDALAARSIKLGHAELLAGLPESTQAGTLAKIVGEGIPVAALKERIRGFALDLGAAIFDKTDCAACPHNSSRQAALFAEAVGEGRCQNRACHADKTRAALDAQKAALQTKYPAVFLDTERSPESHAPLGRAGPGGVGEAQFAACQGCRHFAARLSTRPGEEGKVEAPLCVHLPCHREKVAAANPPPAKGAAASRPDGPPAVPPASPAPPAQADASPKKVEAWVDGWLRRQAAAAAARDPDLLRAWLLAALYREAGSPEAALAEAGVAAAAGSGRRADQIAAFYALDAEGKQRLLLALVQHLVLHRDARDGFAPGESDTVRAARASLAAAGVDLAAAFVPDAEFWKTHTKAGLESLLRRARAPGGETFAAWYGRTHRQSATDDKAFERLVGGKRDDLVAALETAAFDFSAWLPDAIARRFGPPGG
ncbi:MAG: PRTRC system ParB family protein [bacterium]|nr:PRTRC system ParB family protein [bacterium]